MMRIILTCLVAILVPFASMAEHHGPVEAEVRDAVKAFESEVWRRIDGGWKIINLHYSEILEQE